MRYKTFLALLVDFPCLYANVFASDASMVIFE
jgi:hypothetical protein